MYYPLFIPRDRGGWISWKIVFNSMILSFITANRKEFKHKETRLLSTNIHRTKHKQAKDREPPKRDREHLEASTSVPMRHPTGNDRLPHTTTTTATWTSTTSSGCNCHLTQRLTKTQSMPTTVVTCGCEGLRVFRAHIVVLLSVWELVKCFICWNTFQGGNSISKNVKKMLLGVLNWLK